MHKASNDDLIHEALAAGRFELDYERGSVTREGYEPTIHGDGYARISLGGSTSVFVHRVIWLSAHPHTPSTMQVNHRNGRRWDNRLVNLEAVTPAGNVHHAHVHSYAGVVSSAEEMDGNSVDPEWFERVMALAARADVTPEQVAALKPDAGERVLHPYARVSRIHGR